MARKITKKRPVKKAVSSKTASPKQADKKKPVPSTSPKSASTQDSRLFIVGIGASAGGLEAIEGFFAKTPSDTHMAFVIVQHLSPEHKSIMGSLLEKYTSMEIMEVQDGMKVQPNCIYLNSPNKEIDILDGTLHLADPSVNRGIRLPIDHFFRSLADDQGERAICIILSGTGSDGTLGLKAIKGAGGMAMVQTEAQAHYDNMPRSAINTGQVDYILGVEQMATELAKYVQHPSIKTPDKLATPTEEMESCLSKIFIQIRAVTGHDFSHYKRNTITRRIQRRMAVHQLDSLANYVRYLQQNNEEVKTLLKDLLITVTNFFRDPDAFGVLEKKVIPALLENRSPDVPIRVWVSGCATGEEAYSLAMLLAEAMENTKKHYQVQVFATDIDEDALNYARAGVYPEAIAADVSMDRLKKFFIKGDKTFKIKKQIREMVVFAVQNLIKDAPFSRLDLVSCRNVLIYMDSVLQKKILPLFCYTLNPDGFMFLGTSESVGDFVSDFSVVDSKWKVFKRKSVELRSPVDNPVLPFSETRMDPVKMDNNNTPRIDTNVRQTAERVLLQDYGSPCVFVNDRYEIVYFHGKTDAFLAQPSGEPSLEILKLAREELRPKLNTLLRKAIQKKKTFVAEGLKIAYRGDYINFDLTVRPLAETTAEGGLAMVIFQPKAFEVPAAVSKKKGKTSTGTVNPRIIALEQELLSMKEYLQTTIEELETSNEELKSTNEELQSTNEELQSTNEELETSREELQSTNEELGTVNAELQNKVNELTATSNDLNNILGSTDIATVFLDNDLCIKRFTPAAKELFSFIDSDTGRPIRHIVHQLKYDDLLKDTEHVLTKLEAVEKELQDSNGHWFLMKILPYRTLDNTIEGVVVTFFNMTSQKQAQLAAEQARIITEGILDTIHEPLLVFDDAIRVISANPAFYKKFQVSQKDTEGTLLYDLGNKQWDIPKLRELLEEVLPKSSELTNFEVTHDFPSVGRKTMLLNARQIFHKSVGTKTVLLAIEDITGKTSKNK